MKHTSAFFYLSEKGGEDKGGIFRKRILYEGRFVHPHERNKWLEITPEHIKDAVKNFQNNAMDRVQMYFTHNEDPRNLAGKAVGLEEGIDPSDGKRSLYALLKPEDPAAQALMESNAVGVSAGLDHWYKEHASGKDLGMVVKHIALVGEGYIKKLGEFLPIPGSRQLATNIAALSEHTGSIIYLEEPSEGDKKELTKEELLEQAQKLGLKLEEIKKEDKEPELKTKDEVLAAAKELGLVVLTETDHKDIIQAVTYIKSLRTGLKDRLKLGDNDDIATKILEDYTARDAAEQDRVAETEVIKLVDAKKLLPAQKETYKKLYKSDKAMFAELTKDLKPNGAGVKLTETGKGDGDEPKGDENDPKVIEQNIKDALVMADRSGINLTEDGKVLAGVGSKK